MTAAIDRSKVFLRILIRCLFGRTDIYTTDGRRKSKKTRDVLQPRKHLTGGLHLVLDAALAVASAVGCLPSCASPRPQTPGGAGKPPREEKDREQGKKPDRPQPARATSSQAGEAHCSSFTALAQTLSTRHPCLPRYESPQACHYKLAGAWPPRFSRGNSAIGCHLVYKYRCSQGGGQHGGYHCCTSPAHLARWPSSAAASTCLLGEREQATDADRKSFPPKHVNRTKQAFIYR